MRRRFHEILPGRLFGLRDFSPCGSTAPNWGSQLPSQDKPLARFLGSRQSIRLGVHQVCCL
jgi:hypothetical protein